MTTTTIVPASRRRLEGIHSRAWEHPADRAALRALRAVPGFDEVLKKIANLVGERGARLYFRADAVRVTPRQFPRLHRLWMGVMDTLDAPHDYELYVFQSPFLNAGAYGFDEPWVMLESGLLRALPDTEVEFIMGHELGHVLSGHALYHTMMRILILITRTTIGIPRVLALPVLLALIEWYRKSELSADLAGLLAVQNPDAALKSFMRLAGGGTEEEMDLNEFLLQAEEYRDTSGFLDQVMKLLNTMYRTHPFLVIRTAELRDWIQQGEYDRVMRGEYPRRGADQPPWSDDAAEVLRHYTSGADGALEKVGETARRVREAFNRGFRGGGDPKGAPAPEERRPSEA